MKARRLIGLCPIFLIGIITLGAQEPRNLPVSPTNPYWPMAKAAVQHVLSAPSEEDVAGNVFWLSWGATAQESLFSEKASLLVKTKEAWNDLLKVDREKGKKSPLANFWNHLPLLESLRYLKTAPGIDQAEWNRWAMALLPYIEEDFREYGHGTEKNWATKAAKLYPNADAQHAAVMSAAWLVYGDDKYKQNAHEFIVAMETQLRSPGAWLYFQKSTPIPLYHGFEIIFLARCYQLTGDPLAAEQIRRTKDFYPYTYSPENTVEFSTSPWWKQIWNPVGGPYHAVEMVSWITGDGYNRWFADLRAKTFMRQYWVVYCGEAYDDAAKKGLPKPKAFPDQYIVKDESIDGFRGRFGKFSWAGCRGKNAISFASSMLADARYPFSYDGYVQFAHIAIPVPGADGKPYYESLRLVANPDEIPTPGSSEIGEDQAILRTTYIPRLQTKSDIIYDDWKVSESWLFTPKAIVGVLRVESLKDAPDSLPIGIVRMGPKTRPSRLEGDRFAIGGLYGQIVASDFKKKELSLGSLDQYGHEQRYELRLTMESVERKDIKKGMTFSYILSMTPDEKLSVNVTPIEKESWKIEIENKTYMLTGSGT